MEHTISEAQERLRWINLAEISRIHICIQTPLNPPMWEINSVVPVPVSTTPRETQFQFFVPHRAVGWSVDQLVSWSVSGLVSWSVGQLVSWPIRALALGQLDGWLVGRLVGWAIGRLIVSSLGRSAGRLLDLSAGRLDACLLLGRLHQLVPAGSKWHQLIPVGTWLTCYIRINVEARPTQLPRPYRTG